MLLLLLQLPSLQLFFSVCRYDLLQALRGLVVYLFRLPYEGCPSLVIIEKLLTDSFAWRLAGVDGAATKLRCG